MLQAELEGRGAAGSTGTKAGAVGGAGRRGIGLASSRCSAAGLGAPGRHLGGKKGVAPGKCGSTVAVAAERLGKVAEQTEWRRSLNS
jgi:hypothetical protein